MTTTPSLEEKVTQLAARVEELTQRVSLLEGRREAVPLTPPRPAPSAAAVTPAPAPAAAPAAVPPGEQAGISEEVLGWASRASLLPRLATLCFLLVIALVLRTITDNGMINTLLGSGLGMGYAALLVASGWVLYGRKSPLAPVFAATGAVLLATIVVETHARFQSLPLVPAYLTLMAMGIGTAVISNQFRAFLPVSVGTLGMCLAGAAIDYPHPFFPYLSMILLTANLLGYFAAGLKRCSWLRWIVLVVTLLMLQMWAMRLGTTLYRHGPTPEDLALPWFLPVLGIFAAAFLIIALLGIFRTGAGGLAKFDFSLPTVSSVWIFATAYYVLNAGAGSTLLLGVVGVLTAVAQLGVAVWLARRTVAGAPGSNSFAFAGSALLALAFPVATGKFILSLPVLATVAFFMAIMSRKWRNGSIRVTSYALQLYPAVALAFVMAEKTALALDVVNVLPAGLLAIISLYHYQWCRQWPPPEDSPFHVRFDQNDRSAVLLLLTALTSGFFALRTGIYHALTLLGGDISNAFRCSQSILINLSAMVLMFIAFRRSDRELRNVAILVTLIGAVKVFLYDLLGTKGMPLVLSVLSFGIAAAVESILLGRWQRSPSPPEKGADEPPASPPLAG
jgi:hypothetical protein